MNKIKKAQRITLILFGVFSLVFAGLLTSCTEHDPLEDALYLRQLYVWDGAAWNQITTDGGAGGGDVVGPAIATDEGIARYDGVTGRLIQDSGVTINDFDHLNTNGGDITGEDIWANNDVNITNDLDVTDATDIGGALTLSGVVTLENDARAWIEFRPDIDPTKLSVNAKPTVVQRGIAVGYSLPVGGADEELFFDMCVPDRWEGTSDIHCHVEGWLDTAQDEVTDAVELTLQWEHFGIDGVVPATSNTVVTEVVTGVVAQYTLIEFDFIIDYDIDIGDVIEGDDKLVFHLVRSASSHEIAGEIAVNHVAVLFRCNKLGSPNVD